MIAQPRASLQRRGDTGRLGTADREGKPSPALAPRPAKGDTGRMRQVKSRSHTALGRKSNFVEQKIHPGEQPGGAAPTVGIQKMRTSVKDETKPFRCRKGAQAVFEIVRHGLHALVQNTENIRR